MAIKIGTTTVFNNNNNIDWSLISNKPQYVSSLKKTTFGDNTTAGVSANAAYYQANTTLEVWFNTNCACVCCCTPTGCFLGSELVLMANKTWKRLDEVKPGEWVSCYFNGTAPVLGIRQAKVRGNKMFRINNDLITSGEHGFWSEQYKMWLISDKTEDKRAESPWRLVSQGSMNSSQSWHHLGSTIETKQMLVGDKVMVGNKEVEITKIEPWKLPDSTPIYTLITTSSMIIRGGWVTGGWAGKDFDKPIHDDIDRRLKMLRGEISQWTPYTSKLNLGINQNVLSV